MDLEFSPTSIGIAVALPAPAHRLLTAMGAGRWTMDKVRSRGKLAQVDIENVAVKWAAAGFQPGSCEIDIVSYIEGPNFVDNEDDAESNRIIYLGQEVDERELKEWTRFFGRRKIRIAQDVIDAETGQRRVTFDTVNIIGFAVQLIVIP